MRAQTARLDPSAGHEQPSSLTLAREPESVWVARSWAHQELAGWGTPAVFTGRIETVVGELVANAVLHGGDPLEVALVRHPACVVASVSERGDGEVRLHPAGPETLDGSGLFLVARLSERWGIDRQRALRSTRVWAEVPVPAAN